MPLIYKYTKILKQYINPDDLPNMNIYEHPDYPDSPQTENDSFELGKLGSTRISLPLFDGGKNAKFI